jgi:hypothetical protein
MITLINVAAIILLIIVNQPSNKPSKIDQKTGNSILYCGLQYKISAFLIRFLLPLNILIIFFPIIRSFDLQAIIFIAIIGAFIYAGIRLLFMSLRYEIEITKDGVIEKRIIKSQIVISWKMVKRIYQKRYAIEIYSYDDIQIRIPKMMNGSLTFIDAAKKKMMPQRPLKFRT